MCPVNHSLSSFGPVAFLVSAMALIAACSSTSTGTSTGDGGTTASGGGADGGNACGAVGDGTGVTGVALCGLCTKTYCCPEIEACSANATCPTLQTCLLRCEASDQMCITACDNLYPDGVTTYNNLTNCPPQFCGQACSEPPVGCTNVAIGYTGGCEATQFPRVWDCPSGAPEAQCVAAPSGKSDEYCCLQ